MREEVQRTFRDQNELFIDDLLYPTEQITDPKNFDEYIAEGHQRLTSPLLALTLTAIGVAVLLSGEFSRRGQTVRIITAIVLAGAAEAMGLGSKYLAVRYPVLIPVMWLAVLGPFLIALLATNRRRLRRRGPAPVAA
jgi:lipopolysaccharide export system permease protein